jgi:dienelactone hydrolase
MLGSSPEFSLFRKMSIVGDKDDAIFADKVHALAEKLQAAGVACQVEMVLDGTHDFTPAYEAALLRGLAFVAAGR